MNTYLELTNDDENSTKLLVALEHISMVADFQKDCSTIIFNNGEKGLVKETYQEIRNMIVSANLNIHKSK